MTTVAILGAGAWGTALAIHLAERAAAKPGVTLWTRDRRTGARHRRGAASTRATCRASRCPRRSASRRICATRRARTSLFVATPVAALPGPGAAARSRRDARAPLVWLSKGFVAAPALPAGVGLAHQVIAPCWPAAVGIVSGPTLCRRGRARVARRRSPWPRRTPALRRSVAALLRGDTLRAYESDDIAGVEIGGAVKNVLAIAAGASDGLGLRPQRARGADHARPGRNRAAVRGAGRQARDADGTRRAGRSRADLHRRPVAQPPRRIGAGAGQAPAGDPRRTGPRRGRRRAPRPPRARSPRITASRCRSARRCIACCTRTCRRSWPWRRCCGASRAPSAT